MVNDITLTKDTYEVLKRVPAFWLDEWQVKSEIAAALNITRLNVAKRLQHLAQLQLVERRKRQTITPAIEIRRVGKD